MTAATAIPATMDAVTASDDNWPEGSVPPVPAPIDPVTGKQHPHTTRKLLRDAANAAELATGRRETSDLDVRTSVTGRMLRLVGGWLLVLIGIAALPLPGPGWLIIIAGLSMLPYSWAQNLIRVIRRRIPGIPEDGKIPTRTWWIMGTMVVLSLAGSIAFAIIKPFE